MPKFHPHPNPPPQGGGNNRKALGQWAGRLQSALCHSERSEESFSHRQGFFAALRMTGTHNSYFAIVLVSGPGPLQSSCLNQPFGLAQDRDFQD